MVAYGCFVFIVIVNKLAAVLWMSKDDLLSLCFKGSMLLQQTDVVSRLWCDWFNFCLL